MFTAALPVSSSLVSSPTKVSASSTLTRIWINSLSSKEEAIRMPAKYIISQSQVRTRATTKDNVNWLGPTFFTRNTRVATLLRVEEAHRVGCKTMRMQIISTSAEPSESHSPRTLSRSALAEGSSVVERGLAKPSPNVTAKTVSDQRPLILQ